MTTNGSATARQQSPRAYGDFDRMLVNGHWTHGRSGDAGVDLDPFTGSVLVRIPLADRKDLDDAFRIEWARTEGARSIVEGDPLGLVLPPHVYPF